MAKRHLNHAQGFELARCLLCYYFMVNLRVSAKFNLATVTQLTKPPMARPVTVPRPDGIGNRIRKGVVGIPKIGIKV